MKKLLPVLLLLALAAPLFGQQPQYRPLIHTKEISITLDSTATKTVFIPFPSPIRGWHIDPDTTAFTTGAAPYRDNITTMTGDFSISIVPKIGTAEESDSLYAYMQPYTYSKTEGSWYRATNDTTFLVFDTPGTYATTALDYLDWTTNNLYISTLSGETWVTPGLAVTFGQAAADVATASTRIRVIITLVY